MINFLIFIILFFGSINLFKMGLLLVGSDIYELKKYLKNKNKNLRKYHPTVSVIIPAHNEEKNIVKTVTSVLDSDYPHDRFEIIVADDGSTDKTAKLVKNLKRRLKAKNLRIFTQKNQGKAHALNRAIEKYAQGTLIMCLDADSQITPSAISKMVNYFRDKRVVGACTNVKIKDGDGLFNLIQKFEYLINHQMKRALTTYNMEYIIGGVGSTFRKSYLKKIGYYDTNTMTEDIDLTLKIIKTGNIKNRVVYAADVITYTESVPNFKDLIKQRSRWKMGRTQTFYKNKAMFFNTSKKYSKMLTFFYMPLAILFDVLFLLEPLLSGFIIILVIMHGDLTTFLAAFGVMLFYVITNILLENTLSMREKVQYILISPPMYFLIFVITLAEYIGLLMLLTKLPTFKESIAANNCHWEHVERTGATT